MNLHTLCLLLAPCLADCVQLAKLGVEGDDREFDGPYIVEVYDTSPSPIAWQYSLSLLVGCPPRASRRSQSLVLTW